MSTIDVSVGFSPVGSKGRDQRRSGGTTSRLRKILDTISGVISFLDATTSLLVLGVALYAGLSTGVWGLSLLGIGISVLFILNGLYTAHRMTH